MIKTYEFPNGFRCVYEKSKNKLPITSIYLFCDFGSVHENDDIRGLAHFIEHMCFKGTKKIPQSKKLFKEFDNLGIEYNASTFKRYTYYNLKTNDETIHKSLYLLSDIVLNSVFKKKDCDREIKVVIEENIKDQDDKEYTLYDNIDKMIYNGTPFENPIDSIEYHKKPLDYETIFKNYNLFYKQNNMVLSVVSNLSFTQIIKLIKKTFFILKTNGNNEEIHNIKNKLFIPPVLQNDIHFTINREPDINVSYLAISFRICSQLSNEKYTLNLLKVILGGFFSSRLFQLLREDNGLTYSSTVDTEYYETAGDFTIKAITDPNKLIKNGSKKGVIPLLVEMLNDLIKNGITETELILAKNYYKRNMYINLNNGKIAVYNGIQMLVFGQDKNIVPYEKYFDTYFKSITKEQMHDVIKKYFIKSNMNIGLIGNKLPSDIMIKKEFGQFMDSSHPHQPFHKNS